MSSPGYWLSLTLESPHLSLLNARTVLLLLPPNASLDYGLPLTPLYVK
jgi:hypothetical protein